MKINEIITEGFWSSFSRAIGQNDLANQIDAHNKMKDGKAPSSPTPPASTPSSPTPSSGDMTTPPGGAEPPSDGDFTKVATSSTAAALAANRVAKQKAAVAAMNATPAATPAATSQTPEQIRIAKQKAAVAAMKPTTAATTVATPAATTAATTAATPAGKKNSAASRRLATRKASSKVNVADVSAAWKSLGYNKTQIDKMLTAIPPGSTTQSAIKFGLKQSLNAGKINTGISITEELAPVFALLKKEVGSKK